MEDTQASQCHQAPPTPPAGVIDGDGNCAVFKGKEAERLWDVFIVLWGVGALG